MMHNDLRTLTREAPTAVGGYLACISFFRVRVAAASLLDNQRAYELLASWYLAPQGGYRVGTDRQKSVRLAAQRIQAP